MNVPLFFGYLGVLNMIALLPIVGLLYVLNIEPLSQLTWQIFGLLIIKGLFDNVLSDYLWARAVVLTSPTVATIGLSLTIPMAIVSDGIFHGAVPDANTLIASLFVLMGFGLINVEGRSLRDREKPDK